MVNWQVREGEPLSPSGVKVKNEWNCTAAPHPFCCYGADMDNVVFYVYRKGFRRNRISLRMMKSLLFVELGRNYSLKDLPCYKWLRNIDLWISFSFRTFKIAVSWFGVERYQPFG